MKPFNLEAAQQGAPLVTRCGLKVDYIGYAPKSGTLKVVVWIEGIGVTLFGDDGRYLHDSEGRLDLFMVKEMVKIGDLEFPKPLKKPLSRGEAYYAVSLLNQEPIQIINWFGDEDDLLMLQRGLIHLSYEDAKAHYDALMAMNTGENHG